MQHATLLLVSGTMRQRPPTCQNLMISHTYTRHPPNREKLTNPIDDEVAFTAGNVTTSKGPGTSLKFALELGEQLFGKEARDKIQSEMLV